MLLLQELSKYYITLLLAVLLGIKLLARQKSRDVELRYYWLTLICTVLLAVEDVLEANAALDPELRFWRVVLSVIGYILRPTAAVGVLLVICEPKYRTWKVWIPCILNALVNLTAFFSPIAFSFDENYEFTRGPLGYVVFAVSFLYLILILYVVLRRFREGKTAERWILVVAAFGCAAAALIDSVVGGTRINDAILVAGVFLFAYLRSHDNYLDPLTSLRNRFAFYDDSEGLEREITAVASLDMNGLKELNDTKGHAEGDRALAVIGACLNDVTDRRTLAYRVGGDEFTILFLNSDEEEVRRTLQRVRDSVTAGGYSISAGYAMMADGKDLETILHESDRNMYGEKALYYRTAGTDRRARTDG